MATSQTQGQTEIKIPDLEDPEDYHLYVAYSKNAEDKDVGQRIISALKKIKCWDSVAVYSSASQTNAIENGVDRCKAFLLILSKEFMNSGWLGFLCGIIKKKARERYQPNAAIAVRVGNLDDVAIPSVVTDVIKDSQVLDVNDADFDKTIYRFISRINNPNMDVLPVSNVAIGLAWTFYYGYLQMLLPGLPDRIREHEKTLQQTPGERVMPRKAFVIVPVSCLCQTSLSNADSLFVEEPNKKIRYEATRAGSLNRNYDLPVYKLLGKEQDEQTYYVQVQFATPILTMYEMYTGQIAGLRQQELYHQMHLFCYYLRSILRHSQTRACHDKAIIICYDQEDKEANLLSRLVRDRIKREIDREELEEEAIQNRTDTKPIPESLGVRNVTFQETAVSDLTKGRPLLQRYVMEERQRGKALILSVRINRHGARADEEILQQLCRDLEFDVDLRINPTAREMEDALASIQTVDHSQYSAFVCCILAHGRLGVVNGSGNTTAKITDLTHLLNNDVCPGLAGKPKMFFIQACQIDREDSADRRQQSDRRKQTDSSVEHDASIAGNRANLVPGAEDFLMSYATLPGFKAYRDTENGTFYINSLNEKIREHRKERDMDLESILKLVSSQVQSKIKLLVEDSIVEEEQCPFYLATMNKLIFL